MYIRGLIPRNFAALAEAVPIATKGAVYAQKLGNGIFYQHFFLHLVIQILPSLITSIYKASFTLTSFWRFFDTIKFSFDSIISHQF